MVGGGMNWTDGFDQAIQKMMNPKTILDMVDYSSLVVEGIHTWDAPDFCDAFFAYGRYLDGTDLPDDVLELLSEDGELVHEHVLRHIY
jgi:hypothetical protein